MNIATQNRAPLSKVNVEYYLCAVDYIYTVVFGTEHKDVWYYMWDDISSNPMEYIKRK